MHRRFCCVERDRALDWKIGPRQIRLRRARFDRYQRSRLRICASAAQRVDSAVRLGEVIVYADMKACVPFLKPHELPKPADALAARRQDISFLREAFPLLNRSFTRTSRAVFGRRLDDLDYCAQSVSRGGFVMRIARAVSAANDGHTCVLSA